MANFFHNKNSNCRIGFDDRVVMIVMIPIVTFLIPFVFFGMRFQYPLAQTWKLYLSTLIFTIVIWNGNRYIMIWARDKYPSFADVRHRLFVQFSTMILFTLVTNNTLGLVDYLIEGIWLKIPCLSDQSTINRIINTNNASLFSTVLVGTIYESSYFMNELKDSIQEKETLKRENLNAQLDALQTQINPHFLFNNLNTLTAIIPEDADTAVNFVQQLSKVYRHILEVKDEATIDLQTELKVLKAYAFLLKTRFTDSLTIEINVDDKYLDKKIIPLALQLLLENAIKHNIVSQQRRLLIQIFAQNDYVVVCNNLQLKQNVADSTGFGLKNIQKRYQLLSTKEVIIENNQQQFTVKLPLI